MSEINVKEDLLNLLTALEAVTPSRSYVSQYITMMPMDYPSTYDMFPEFLSTPELRTFLGDILGIDYGANVSLRVGFAYYFRDFLERVFTFFEDVNIRQKLSALTGVSDDALPNPRKEWVEVRIKGVRLIPRGQYAIKILTLILESLEPAEGWQSFNSLIKLLNLNESDVRQIINLLISKYRLIIRDDRGGKEGYRLADDVNRYRESLSQIAAESSP